MKRIGGQYTHREFIVTPSTVISKEKRKQTGVQRLVKPTSAEEATERGRRDEDRFQKRQRVVKELVLFFAEEWMEDDVDEGGEIARCEFNLRNRGTGQRGRSSESIRYKRLTMMILSLLSPHASMAAAS